MIFLAYVKYYSYICIMKKINELFSLEWASDCYFIDDNLNIVNVKTGNLKSKTIGKRGYYYVTLNRRDDNKQVKVYYHKIVALAFIHNGPYDVINHIDGNKLNDSVSNLEFCSQKHNVQHAFKTKLVNRNEKRFLIRFLDGSECVMTAKDASNIIGIPRITLYDLYYKHSRSPKWSIAEVISEESVETIESK